MTTSRRIAALIAIALVLAACSASTPTGTASQTPAADPSTPPSLEATADPSDTPGPGGPTPTGDPTAGPSEAPRPTQAPDGARVEPPSPGTYTYRQDGTTKAGAFTFEDDEEGTLLVDAARGREQVQTRSYSDSSSIEQTLRFAPSGVYIAKFVSRFFTSSITCELRNPMLVIANMTDPGVRWTDADRCEGRSITATGEVIKAERRRVGGEPVDTLKLRLTLTLKGGGLDQTTRTTAWVSPEHRLVVRSVSHAEGKADGQSFSQDRTEDLVSLTPA